MVSKTAVQQFAYFQVKETANVIENRRIYNVAYACNEKISPTTSGYQIVTESDYATYTDDPYVIDFFKEGLTEVMLVFSTLTEEEMTNEVAVKNYSLSFSPLVDYDAFIAPSILGLFDGVKYYSYRENQFGLAESRALIQKNVVTIDDFVTDTSLLANRLVARFIVQNQCRTALQVSPFSDKTTVVELSQVAQYRNAFLSFLIKDNVTITTPVVAYFIGGSGEPLPAIYQFENIKNQIEARITQVIANIQPKYINQMLSALETEAQEIIDRNIPDILASGSLTIPRKNKQTMTDIKLGFVKNAKIELKANSDIWEVTGTAEKTISFLSEFQFQVGG